MDTLDDAQPGVIGGLSAAQAGTVGSQLVVKTGSEVHDRPPRVLAEVPDSIGGPSRTRTLDPLIKSPDQPTAQ